MPRFGGNDDVVADYVLVTVKVWLMVEVIVIRWKVVAMVVKWVIEFL